MLHKILKIVLVVFILLLGYLVYDFFSFTNNSDKQAVNKEVEATTLIDEQINQLLKEVMAVGDEVKNDIENQDPTAVEINTYIKKKTLELDQLLGITVAFEPYAFQEDKRLFSPYYDRNQDKIIYLEDLYDYTNHSVASAQWYTDPLKNGKEWVEPYYAQAAQTLVSDYTLPFYYKKGNNDKVRCIIALTISLKQLTEITRKISLGDTGYAFIASQENQILSHPINEYIGQKSIEDLIKKASSPQISDSYRDMLNMDKGNKIALDEEKNQEVLFFYDRVAASGWKIGVTFFKNDLLGNDHLLKRKYINIAMVTSLILFLLLALYFNRDYLSTSEIWRLSEFAILILIGNLVFAGYLEYNAITPLASGESPPITNERSLGIIINDQKAIAIDRSLGNVITIPTGIYIDQIQFKDSYNVRVSGTIWQKYSNDLPTDFQKGIRLPQTTPFAEAAFIEERYRKEEAAYTLIGYEFRNTLKLNLRYGNYPFDKQHLHLEIQPVDFQNNILLIPDLDSYTYNSPALLSGISETTSITGSEYTESYFSYAQQDYATNFGFKEKTGNDDRMNLFFNVNMKRKLITSFVTYLIPIFVTLVLIFIMLMSARVPKEGVASGLNIVQAMGAFFFVLVFSHIDLRKTIESSELIFMEYFYLVSYFMIILATFNLIMYKNRIYKLFNYENNLFAKVTYWPVFLLAILVISWMKFY